MSPLKRIVQYIDDEEGVRRCYPVMVQLRPHLTTEDEFVACWHRQVHDGYRLLALLNENRVDAIAGFRVQENLVYGRFLYIDDLVTDEAKRGSGFGELLLTHLKQEACNFGCSKLVLDTALSNSLGQRFYFRNGLLAAALRFNIAITQ